MRSERASRAARARWDAVHAALAGEPVREDPPACRYILTLDDCAAGVRHRLVLRTGGRRRDQYRVDADGKPWKATASATLVAEALRKWIVKRHGPRQ